MSGMFQTPLRNRLRVGSIIGAALFLCAAFNASGALAQDAPPAKAPDRPSIDEVLRGLSRGRTVGQVAVSPDGMRLAWIEWATGGTEIRVAPVSDLKKSDRVTAAAKPEQHCHEGDLAWSPKSSALAFFSDCAVPGDQTDLYLSTLEAKPVRRLTELKGYVEAPAFSPDGKSVAFLYVEGATRPAGALAAMKPPAGVIGEDGVEIQRVALADTNAPKPGPPVLASPANLHVYEFDWSPDSKALAYRSEERRVGEEC